MTHVSLHRCRFIDYPPHEITALSFSLPSRPSSPLPPPPSLRLALGRSNGQIEIWNPLNGAWHHEATFPGGRDRTISGLTWSADGRLFSTGYSSAVTEWDLATGRPRASTECHGGTIWSIAARGGHVVVGTEDGAVKLLTTENGELGFVRNLMRAQKTRVLALAWVDDEMVVAGCADAKLRVWDVRSGRCVARCAQGRRDVVVWGVKVTERGTVVSVDSKGEVCWWDSGNWTLKQRVKAHEGDCLALEVGADERVITGGADMRTVVFTKSGKGRWIQEARKRLHRHDVRAMAVYESGGFSMVVTGGVDMTPIVTSFRDFATAQHLVLSYVPATPIVQSVPEDRLLMSFWGHEVKIWTVDELAENLPETNTGNEEQGRKLLARVVLSNDEFITTAALSCPLPHNSGYFLAIATAGEIKLFHLRPSKRESGPFRIHKLTVPDEVPVKTVSDDDEASDSEDDDDEIPLSTAGARILHFSPTASHLLIVTPDSTPLLAPLSGLPSLFTALYALPAPSSPPSAELGQYTSTIHRAAISSTHIALTNLAGATRSFTYSGTAVPTALPPLPRLPSASTICSLRPNSPDLLLLPAADHQLTLFHLPTSRITLSPPLPSDFSRIRADRAIDSFWEPDGNRIWIRGAGWVWMFDISKDWETRRSAKRKRRLLASGEEKEGERMWWGSSRWRELLAFVMVGSVEEVKLGQEEGSVKAQEVAVVERAKWDVGLPERFYGAK